MNEEEFLKQYMGESGIYEQSRAFGRRKAEEDIVEDYFKHFGTNESYNNFFREKDKKYKQYRDEAFTSKYGEGFPEMYDKYKPVGEGAFGAVFQNPDDPSKVFKVQRQPGYLEQDQGNTEVERQTQHHEWV